MSEGPDAQVGPVETITITENLTAAPDESSISEKVQNPDPSESDTTTEYNSDNPYDTGWDGFGGHATPSDNPSPATPSPAIGNPSYVPPTAALHCPEDFEVDWNQYGFVEFGYRWTPGNEYIESWSIDYGDGKSYTSTTPEDAEENLFWHEYDQPGTYTAHLLIADSTAAVAASASCTFAFTQAAPPDYQVPPPTGGDIGSGSTADGWLGCHFDGIPMWGQVRVVDFGEDIAVRVVDYGEDLKVRLVDFGARSCGLWHEANFGEDFTIRFVDFGEDVAIRFVDFGEGR